MPVSVEINIISPSLINNGVSTSKPVSTITFFCAACAVFPFTASGELVTFRDTFAGSSMSKTSELNLRTVTFYIMQAIILF